MAFSHRVAAAYADLRGELRLRPFTFCAEHPQSESSFFVRPLLDAAAKR